MAKYFWEVVFLQHVKEMPVWKIVSENSLEMPVAKSQARVVVRGNKKIECISWRSSYKYLDEKKTEESNCKLSSTKIKYVGGWKPVWSWEKFDRLVRAKGVFLAWLNAKPRRKSEPKWRNR